MDFAMSAKTADYHRRLSTFMIEHIFPAEAGYERRVEIGREKSALAEAVI
jgi:hypothetical protein